LSIRQLERCAKQKKKKSRRRRWRRRRRRRRRRRGMVSLDSWLLPVVCTRLLL